MQEEDLTKKYNGLYLEIIMRYKEDIEKGETIYLAELPKLVMPNDETVLAEVKSITSSFPTYNFDENFLEAVQKVHTYVKDEITTVNPSIQFWLRPNQVISLQAGDVFDKVILLCSMLIALGNVSTKIITAVNDTKKKQVVCCEYKGEIFSIDVENGISKAKSKEEILESMGIREGAGITAYEFNDKMYNDLL